MLSVSGSNAGPPSVTFVVSDLQQPTAETSMASKVPRPTTTPPATNTDTTTPTFAALSLLEHWAVCTANSLNVSDLVALLLRITRSVRSVSVQQLKQDATRFKQVIDETQVFIREVVGRLRDAANQARTLVESALETVSLNNLGDALDTIQTHQWLAHCRCLSTESTSSALQALETEVNTYVYNMCCGTGENTSGENGSGGSGSTAAAAATATTAATAATAATATAATATAAAATAAPATAPRECIVITLMTHALSRCVCEVAALDVPVSLEDQSALLSADLGHVKQLVGACSSWARRGGGSMRLAYLNNLMGRITRLWRQESGRERSEIQHQRSNLLLSMLEDVTRLDGASQWCLNVASPTNKDLCGARCMGSSLFSRSPCARGSPRRQLRPLKKTPSGADTCDLAASAHLSWLSQVTCVLDKRVRVLPPTSSKTASIDTECGQEDENPCLTAAGSMLYSGLYLWMEVSGGVSSGVSSGVSGGVSSGERSTNNGNEQAMRSAMLRLLGYRIRMWLMQCVETTHRDVTALAAVLGVDPHGKKQATTSCEQEEQLLLLSCTVFVDITAMLTLIANKEIASRHFLCQQLSGDLQIMRSKLTLLILEVTRVWWCAATAGSDSSEAARTSIEHVVRTTLLSCLEPQSVRVLTRSIQEMLC